MIDLDDRAVSTAVSHALSIAITSIMISGLLIGSSQMLDDQRQRVTEQGLQDVGSAITSEIVRIETFNTIDTSVSVTADYPDRIGGRPYSVQLREPSGGNSYATLHLNTSDPELDLVVLHRMSLDTDVCDSYVDGGTIAVAYDESADCIELRDP